MFMLVAEPITGQMSQHITQLNKAINRACAVLINAHLYVVHSGLSVAMYMLRKVTLNVMANTSNHCISASPVCDGYLYYSPI